MSPIEQRDNLQGIMQRIQSAMGLCEEKSFHLAVTSGKRFGWSVKVGADALFSQAMFMSCKVVPASWEEVIGYDHRIPCILTTPANRGMQPFDAFRLENLFGLPVPRRKLDEIRNNIKNSHSTTVDHGGLLTALLKLWLEELPHPLLELDETDGMLMREVLQGKKATVTQIRMVMVVNNKRGIISAQRCICEYVLNLLVMTVENSNSKNE